MHTYVTLEPQDRKIPANVSATSNIDEALKDADVIIHCIPAQHTPKFVQSIASKIPSNTPYVSTAKGIHVASHSLMSEAIPRALGEHAKRVQLAYLSGPSFAKEMVKGHPVSVIVASYALGDGTKPPQPETAIKVQNILNAERFRIYVSDDVMEGSRRCVEKSIGNRCGYGNRMWIWSKHNRWNRNERMQR